MLSSTFHKVSKNVIQPLKTQTSTVGVLSRSYSTVSPFGAQSRSYSTVYILKSGTSNSNGLKFEKLTDLETEYQTIEINKHSKQVYFNENPEKFYYFCPKSNLFKFMNCDYESVIQYQSGQPPRGTDTNLFVGQTHMGTETNLFVGHGCKYPDECFVNVRNKQIYIIEKKYQKSHGSMCEKIQTPHFKLWQYNKCFPNYTVHYMYCLSEWFKTNCKAELEYLKEFDVPVFFGEDDNYKYDMVSYIPER